MIIQEEVEPYEMVGLFETEPDADQFIGEYLAAHELKDATHLEKYQADLTYQGQGPSKDELESERSDPDKSWQLDLDGMLSQE